MDLHGKTATVGVPGDASSQPDAIQNHLVTPLVNKNQKISVDRVQAQTLMKPATQCVDTCHPSVGFSSALSPPFFFEIRGDLGVT